MQKINGALLFVVITMLFSCKQGENKNSSNPVESNVSQEALLQKSVAAFPDSILLRENLVQYYRDNGHYEMALKEINEGINRDSTTARLWDIKAILHFEDGDTVSSIHAFEKALEITPYPPDMISLGTLYAQTSNNKALSLADTLLRYHKEDAEKQALFIKGLYYSFTKTYQTAIEYFDRCLSIDFNYMDAYREKAIALYELGKYDEGLTVLNRAVTLQNNFDEGYYYKGRFLEKLKRLPEAIEAYQMALMYSPDYTEARDALARLGVKS